MSKVTEIKKTISNLKNKYGLAAVLAGSTSLGVISNLVTKDNEDTKDKKEYVIKEHTMTDKEKSDGMLMSNLIMLEGCAMEAYADDIGVWTYGIGSTKKIDGNRVRKGDTLKDNDEAYKVAEHHVKERIDYVFDYIKRELTPEQKAALKSFMYNCGAGTIVKDEKLTELGQAVNDGNDDFVVKEMLQYNKAGGSFMRGLFARRVLEAYEYQGFIKMEDLQSCPIGGLSQVCYNDKMMDTFKVKLSKKRIKVKGRRRYKATGSYDDAAITDRLVAREFIKICQQPIKGPISKKLEAVNIGKPICDFLPDQLVAKNLKQFEMAQEANVATGFIKTYNILKDKFRD